MSKSYKPEDVDVIVTLPDGTEHVCAGFKDPYGKRWAEEPYHTVIDGEWNIEAYKELDSENNI